MVSLADISISRGYESDSGPVEDVSYLAMESVFTAPEIGRDERRMQVRAYNHWLAAVRDGELPPIEELHPERLDDLGPSAVLVDLTLGLARPAIIFLGDRLASECGEDREIFGLGDVPQRSLLSRLTEHCLDVVANRAPVGFEAEFVNRAGTSILYRSMLLPYSSDGTSVDFVFGVISWKEEDRPPPLAAARIEAEPEPLEQNADSQTCSPPRQGGAGGGGSTPMPYPHPNPSLSECGFRGSDNRCDAPVSLADLLASARQLAAEATLSEQRSHRALYAAIARLLDCALVARRDPQGLATLIGASGLPWQERAPLVALARLAFGPAWPRSRLSEIGRALDCALRRGLDGAGLQGLLEATPGGLKGLISAERRRDQRRPTATRTAIRPRLARKLNAIPASASLQDLGEFALLVARRNRDGSITLLGDPGDPRLLEAAAKRLISG